MLLNFDKAGAEWVVVAYLTGDEAMLSIAQDRSQDAHSVTASRISRVPVELVLQEHKIVKTETEPNRIEMLRHKHLPTLYEKSYFLPRSMSLRQMGKKSNHGLNYDEGYKTFALINEMSEKEAKSVVRLYKFKAYKGIDRWHRAIQEKLLKDRTLTNCFDRKCYFMEGWGPDLFKQAYAFIPQATVGDMVNEGLVKAMNDGRGDFKPLQLLAQVHDSAEFQYLSDDLRALARVCIKIGNDYMRPKCRYVSMVPNREEWEFPPTEREFYIETDLKVGMSKGAMTDLPIYNDVERMENALKAALTDDNSNFTS